jgi:hypothetical protein
MRVYPIVVGRQTATPKQNFVVAVVVVVVSVVALNGYFSSDCQTKRLCNCTIILGCNDHGFNEV